MEPLGDDDLIRMYREGDADAFDVLFHRHATAVHHFARMLLGDTAAADDVLQETFLAVACTAVRYEPRGRFRPWLMRIVRNRCLNRLDARRRREAVLGRSPCPPAELPSPRPGPSSRAEADEHRRAVEAALGELPDRQREAISLYAFGNMRYRQIAEVLQMPVNTVKTLIHRARANLARALETPAKEPTRELRRDL